MTKAPRRRADGSGGEAGTPGQCPRMEGILCAPTEGSDTMSDKSKSQKKRLAKKENQNQRVPAWVMMKTDMNVTRNPKRRNWRRNDLDE